MKVFNYIFVAFIAITQNLAQASVPGEFGIHLFFDEKEFVDTMTISQGLDGNLVGNMDVPNDFSGPLANLKMDGLKIEFDLFVPKNLSRPVDLVFHYSGYFFDETHEQLIGFVTTKDTPAFTASFTGFKRK